MVAASHPARRFHALGDHLVIGILLVVRPGVPANHRIHLQQPDQEDQAALQLVLRDVAHAVVAVIQIEDPIEAQDPRHLVVVALVAENVLADGAGCTQPGASPMSSLVARTR